MAERDCSAKRPRGGEVWRRSADGARVVVRARRLTDPVPGRHGIQPWSLVLWTGDDEGFGVEHEIDFVASHAFVGKQLTRPEGEG